MKIRNLAHNEGVEVIEAIAGTKMVAVLARFSKHIDADKGSPRERAERFIREAHA
jgi:hypothetical protein